MRDTKWVEIGGEILKSILCFYSHLVQGDIFLHNLKRELEREREKGREFSVRTGS